MGWRPSAPLLPLLVIVFCWQPGVAAADETQGLLSPLLSPITNAACDAVQCGKGNCTASADHAFGFVCECEPGWTKIHFGDHLQFLPCIIPNCTFDYSCAKSATAPPPTSSPSPPLNWSLFDPCAWSYCGDGTCLKTSAFGHQCSCNPGGSNLLNYTNLPCFQECVFGADCASLGLVLANASSPSSSSSSSSLSGQTASTSAFGSPRSFIFIFSLMVALSAITWT